MDLHLFQSEKGDCLLLEGSHGGRVLCDGGMARSMRNHVRDHLGSLHEKGERIDVAYVSHIDQDHIAGVLQLLEDLLEWRVFEHHRARGDDGVREPRFPRPPEIGGLWHNAFRDLISRNRRRLEDFEVAFADRIHALFGTGIPAVVKRAAEMQGIASSIPQALKVSRLVRADLLDIPFNSPPGRPGPGQLLMVEDPNPPIDVGSLRFHLVGPSKKQLAKLRRGWNQWLRDPDNRERTRRIRREMARRVEEFATGIRETTPFDLGDWNGVPDFEGVTAPNTASLMFLVEDAGRTLLLTGDSQQDVILEGLRDTGHLEDGHVHVDVLKVPHHGSEHNADRNFCRRVSADHYVFCGDGSHGNPERKVLELFYESRMGKESHRARSPRARDREFTFWFSTTAARQPSGSASRRSFLETEQVVADMVARSNGRMHARFNGGDFVTLRV